MPRFATAAQLASLLQRTFDVTETAAAELALDLVTGAIKGYTRQTIEAVANDAVTLRGTHRHILELPERPVTAVSSVVLDGTALTADGYSWPAGFDHLVRSGGWGGPNVGVAVTYSHGFAVIPDDVRGVCLEAAARLLANPEGVGQESIGNYSITHARGAELTLLSKDEQRQLDGVYRRKVWS